MSLLLYLPWLINSCKFVDLYSSLKNSSNSKFIFNDYINNTISLDGGDNIRGVIHKFSKKDSLCILPVNLEPQFDKKILNIKLDLSDFQIYKDTKKPNIYFRFYIEPPISSLSTRKTGISKSTIIYDIKVNEKRNIPESLISVIKDHSLCNILSCFCLNVVPNSYELTFLDTASLKNVRTLEYDSFNKYLKDKRVEKDELIVIFNKKEDKTTDSSYTFFSIFFKECIGAGQFALAVLVNLICGILLFFPGFRKNNNIESLSSDLFLKIPVELYLALILGLGLLFYFIWPWLIFKKNNFILWFAGRIQKK